MARKPPQGYKDLEIYRLAHEWAVKVHFLSFKLPKYEWYAEGDQMRRSSKSVASNIVEGFCRRRYKGDYIRFLTYAHGSCNETIEHLELLYKTKCIDKAAFDEFFAAYDKLGRKLNRFIKSVIVGHKPGDP